MKLKVFLFAVFIVFCSVFFSLSCAVAQERLLWLQATSDGVAVQTEFINGTELYLNIVVDNVKNITGCVFTLLYPPAMLRMNMELRNTAYTMIRYIQFGKIQLL